MEVARQPNKDNRVWSRFQDNRVWRFQGIKLSVDVLRSLFVVKETDQGATGCSSGSIVGNLATMLVRGRGDLVSLSVKSLTLSLGEE